MDEDDEGSRAPVFSVGKLERVTRFERATSSLARKCSTTELHPLFLWAVIVEHDAAGASGILHISHFLFPVFLRKKVVHRPISAGP